MVKRSILVSCMVACLLAPSGIAEGAERIWLGADGEPLPFTTDAELLDFLKTARVVSQKTLSTGINRPRKVLLEKDGIRAHAVFRDVDIRKRDIRVGDRLYMRFADSYLFECAAYELARLIGLDSVPPTVLREIGRTPGSLQLWIEDIPDETGENFRPPDPFAWVSQLWEMYFFDSLVFNVDRNKGNLLVDSRYKLWLIDHTRAFQAIADLLDGRITRVNRKLFDRLVELSEDEIRRALSPYLDAREMGALMRRRQVLIEHVRKLASEYGEDVVFY